MEEKIKRALLVLLRLIPLRRMIIFESHPDLSDNSYALYQELLRRGLNKRWKIYWIQTFRDGKVYDLPEHVETLHKEPKGLLETLKHAYVMNCSKCIIDCNSFIYKRRAEQVRIHLGHGMPIKIDLEYSRKFGDCDKYMIQSDFWKDIYKKDIGVPEEILCDAGYPRNDVLVNTVKNEVWQQSVKDFHKVVVWMPTYRQHRLHRERGMESRYPYGMPSVCGEEELRALQELLVKEKIFLLFRPHPVQDLSVFAAGSFSHIQIADDDYLSRFGMSLYELLGNTDALITDYSSVYFDYLLTDRPIGLTVEDKEEYFTYFTLAFPDYPSYIKGSYIENFGGLLEFFRQIAAGDDRNRKERLKAKRRFHSDTSGTSAEKIADLLAEEYGIR